MNAQIGIIVVGGCMLFTPVHAVASSIHYLETSRRVFASLPSESNSSTYINSGVWSDSVFGDSGGVTTAKQNSSFLDSSIQANRFCYAITAEDAPIFAVAESTMYAKFRLDEQCVVSFNGTVSKFLDTPTSAFTFSLSGGAFSYFYEAPAQGDTGTFTFAQSNLVLDPGIYEFQVRGTVAGGYGNVDYQFRLDAAIVPAPGAGGLAAAVALLASRRQRRAPVLGGSQ